MQDHRPASPCLVLLELLNEVIFLSRFLIPLFRRPQTRYGIDIRSQSSSSVRALDEKMLVIIGMLTFKGVAVGFHTGEKDFRSQKTPRKREAQDGILIVIADCRIQGRDSLSLSLTFSLLTRVSVQS